MRSSPIARVSLERQPDSSTDRLIKGLGNKAIEPFTQSSDPVAVNPPAELAPTEAPPALISSSTTEEDTTSRDEEYALEEEDEDEDAEDDNLGIDDDPYTYSDDSSSMSDAYFLQPPHDHGLSVFGLASDTESDRDPLESPGSSTFEYLFPSPSLGKSKTSDETKRTYKYQFGNSHHNDDISTSLGPPIDEEVPVTESTSLMQGNHGTVSPYSYKKQERKRRKLRNHQRNLMLQQHRQKQYQQQKIQEKRELAVTKVRGKWQPATLKDRYWLIPFVLQLFYVIFCAVKYGVSLTTPSVTTLPSSDGLSALTYQPLPLNLGMASVLAPTGSTTEKIHNTYIEHLEDDDNLTPKVPEKRSEDLRSNVKSTNEKTATTRTVHADGSTTVVVENAPFTIDYKNVLYLLLISGAYACVTSYLSFAFMLIVARSLISIMLVFTVLLLFCWGIFGFTVTSYGGFVIPVLGFTFFGFSLAYTMLNWNHIPFCSTNLYTAICALRSSVMVLLAGGLSLFVALLWLFLWSIALMGILNAGNGRDCAIWDDCETHIVIRNGRLVEQGILLVSLYWTTIVIKNIVRVSVANAIGSWWMQSDASFCEPLTLACTNSLGTICFGSLVGFPAQTLSLLGGCMCWASGGLVKPAIHWSSTPTKRKLAPSAYEDEEAEHFSKEQEKVAHALAQKISEEKNCLHRFGRKLQACNRWSYTYIGMYNYSFLEGGEKAIELFETREWMAIVRDNMIQNILVMASIVIGASTAVVAVVVEEVDGYTFTSLNEPVVTSFWIGFLMGFVLSNILLLGVVGSAVNTILVCFAAEPFQFDRNHPRLSREMREVWSQQVWEPEPELN